ncbi:MAG: response regulator, partial [Myxococcota bacterium]
DATVVASAAEALDRLAGGGRYDLVLSDVMMPDIDGIELARRCADRQPPVPVALVSGAKRPDLRGVPNVGYLVKPLDADRLGRFLDTALGARRTAAPDAESWSGAEFLARVSGPVERFPPSRVLFLAHRVGATGALRVTYGGVTGTVGLRGGKVVQVTGVPHLLAGLGPGVSDARDLATDVGAAVAKGHPPDKVLHAAAEGLGTWLARTLDATGGTVTFDPRWTAPPGAFPLPEPVPRFLARGLQKARPDAEVARAWAALGSATVRLRLPDDAPESTWGLDATSTRLVRLAERTRTVERLLFHAAPRDDRDTSSSARRVDVLRALDMLRALGLLVVDGGALDRSTPEAAAGPAVEATQEDPRADRLATALNAMERAHPVEILDLADRR